MSRLLFFGEEKTHGMREFMFVNDRLSTFLTLSKGKKTIM